MVETPSESSPPEASAVLPKDGYWPDFRGPHRDGRYDDGPVLTDWPEDGLRQLWKHPIGLGYASFVVADGRAFTIEQRRDYEVVSAYEVESGRELWTVSWPGEFVETMGGDGPRATPTYHEGRVYALGALGELRCLDAVTGQMVWRRNILSDANASNLSWGMAGSPLIVDDKVIVLPGGRGGRSVAAYDKRTGEPVWTALDDRQAYYLTGPGDPRWGQTGSGRQRHSRDRPRARRRATPVGVSVEEQSGNQRGAAASAR